ncbi:ABC transporter permease [Aliifodinibius sp. S!AR15-10]|uniref:ABC transporter permease n=1 Tax=Aliifodinibius sp. S!AR15-10 TaxID=2950437 RepID=UPI002860FDC0|nr:ABC transporter permease [Aliifodinibius sp. S!AR15-10]MDR8394129.1 ABC transporter permease [Aliifodinibius sp. S!AR15-10]
MNFEWYLALRYFKGKRKGSRFLSFIKTMAITGVAVGSAGLLIALSIVHGFKSVINTKILGFAPHITVTTYSNDPIYRADTLLATLEKYPEIEQAQAIVSGQAMIQSPDEISGIFLKGVDQQGDISQMRSYISEGTYDLTTDSTGLPGIILGAELARNLRSGVGSVLTSYTIQGIPTPLNSPDIQQFRVSGIYQTGIDRFDDVFAMVDRQYARELFKVWSPKANAVEVKLREADQIQIFDAQLTSDMPFPYFTETIYDRYGNIFAWVDLQESTIPFVISVMIIVAAFNLIGTILMMVLERTRDIGILKTMGAPDKSVKYVFLLEGFFVAAVGLVIGIALSLLFVWLQSTYHIIPLSEQNYYMAYAPVEPHGLDFLIVSVVTFLLCSLASWLPARVASKTDPLKVIAFGR